MADAMMVALYRQISYELKNIKCGKDPDRNLNDILRTGTSSGCRVGSAYALMYLYEKHSFEFQKLLMVETSANARGEMNGPWAWHDYFLVLGTDDVWYAGSPANYGRGCIERTTNVIASNRLHQVMSTIKKIEGRLWPDPKTIESINRRAADIIVWNEGESTIMSYVCVKRKAGEESVERMKIKF